MRERRRAGGDWGLVNGAYDTGLRAARGVLEAVIEADDADAGGGSEAAAKQKL